MMNIMMTIIKSMSVAILGLIHAYREDKSFRLEVLVGLPIYGVLGYILAPLQPLEWLLFVGSYFLILIVELINTSIEKLLDRLHPERHELIQRSKDIASGAVLLTFLFAGVIILTLYFTHAMPVFYDAPSVLFA